MGYYVKDNGQLERMGTYLRNAAVSVDGNRVLFSDKDNFYVAAQFEEVLKKTAEKYPQYEKYLHSRLDKNSDMDTYYDIFRNVFSVANLSMDKEIENTETYENILGYLDIPENEKENLLADENFYQCVLGIAAETASLKKNIEKFTAYEFSDGRPISRLDVMSEIADLMGMGELVEKPKEMVIQTKDGQRKGTCVEIGDGFTGQDIDKHDVMWENKEASWKMFDHPKILRDIANLKILDYICRDDYSDNNMHLLNNVFHYDKEKKQITSVKRIMSDFSFANMAQDSNFKMDMLVIDEKTANLIKGLTEEHLQSVFEKFHMNREEMDGVFRRVKQLQERIAEDEAYFSEQKSGKPADGLETGRLKIIKEEEWQQLSLIDLAIKPEYREEFAKDGFSAKDIRNDSKNYGNAFYNFLDIYQGVVTEISGKNKENPEETRNMFTYQERSTSRLGERYQETQQMMLELEKADPFYVSSSREFKKMKAVLKELSDIQKRLPKIPSEEQYQELLAGYKKLNDASRKYLEKKEGIEPKKGSNAEKRLKIAKKLNDFAVFHGGALEAETEKALEQREKNRSRQEQMREEVNRGFGEQEKREKLEKQLEEGMNNIRRTEQNCYEIYGPSAKEINKPEAEMSFVEKCLNAKNKENDFKIPEELHITEQEAALLTMVSLGTVEVGKHYKDPAMADSEEGRTYGCVSFSIEDMFNERKNTEKNLVPTAEVGRKKVGESLEKFADGKTRELGELLAEGLKRYTAAFTPDEGGISEKNTAAFKIAANIYDMLKAHPEMLKAAQDPALGEKRLSEEVLKNYRGAKESYLLYKESIEAKQQLLSADKKPASQEVKKAALAKIILENVMNQKIKKYHFEQTADIEKQKEQKMKILEKQITSEKDPKKQEKIMSEMNALNIGSKAKIEMFPEQKELTEEKRQKMLNVIAENPVIATVAEKMKDLGFMEIFGDAEKEEVFFKGLIQEIQKNGPKVEAREAEKDVKKQQQVENVPQL